MKRKFSIFSVLCFCSISAFAADDHKYRSAYKFLGGDSFPDILKTKMKEETLDVDDVKTILEKGVFAYRKGDTHSLSPISKDETTVKTHYSTKFFGKEFVITYKSRSLGQGTTIPETASIELIEKKNNEKYTYLLISDPDVYQFSLQLSKLVKLSPEESTKMRYQSELATATDLIRPPSVYGGISPQDIQAEHEKADQIEKHIEKSKKKSLESGMESSSSSGTSEQSTASSSASVKELVRQRTVSSLPTLGTKKQLSETVTGSESPRVSSTDNKPPRRVSFAQSDLTSSYTTKEQKKISGQLNKRSKFADSKTASMSQLPDMKALAKKAKETQKAQEKEKKKAQKEEEKAKKKTQKEEEKKAKAEK